MLRPAHVHRLREGRGGPGQHPTDGRRGALTGGAGNGSPIAAGTRYGAGRRRAIPRSRRQSSLASAAPMASRWRPAASARPGAASHWARSASGPAAGLFVVPAVVVGSGGYSAAHDAQGVQQPGRRVTREKSAAGPCRARRRRTTRPGSYGAKVWAARTAKAVLRSCPGRAARRPGRLGGRSNWRPPPASLTCRYCSAPLAGPGHLLRLRPSASSAYTARAAVRDRSEAMERGRGGARGPGPGLGGSCVARGGFAPGRTNGARQVGRGVGLRSPCSGAGRRGGRLALRGAGRGAGVPGRLYAPVP